MAWLRDNNTHINKTVKGGVSQADEVVMKPTNGWKDISRSGNVWEHTNKARVHTGGLIKLPNGDFFHLNSNGVNLGHKLIAINGGNRKRGLMALAMNLMAS
jgi:hypothetical protein